MYQFLQIKAGSSKQKAGMLAVMFFLLSFMHAGAQFSADYRRAADNYFRKGDYSSAVNYYEKYLSISRDKKRSGFDPYTAEASKKAEPLPDKQLATYQLAESWRLLNNYTNAAPLYQMLVDKDTAFPLAGFHYATSLRALGRYADAEESFQRFLDSIPGNESYKEAARREVKNLQYIRVQLQKDISDYAIEPLAKGRHGASYAPAALGEDKILFTATWPDSNAAANKVHLNRLYEASFSNGALANISNPSLPSATLHEGAAAITADGNTLYFTRWEGKDSQKHAAIYVSKKIDSISGSQWSGPVLLDSMVNVPGYNTQQPYITKDGKYLLFASDRPGGLGGYDLWYAVLDEKGKPVRIQNLGELNTPLNEQAPYFHEPSSTLVFASDGRIGMGGYDLFFVKGNIGAWSQPENFGHPVNSAKDDMYFTSFSKGRRVLENALFSSDRADVCCLELFHLARKAPPKHIMGQIVACDSKTPLAGVAVDVVDTTTGMKMFSGTTDSEGRYSFTVSQTTPLNSVASLKGYYTTARPLQWSADADADSLVSAPVCMEKELLVVDEVQILNNVYYEFAKADIRPESYPSLDDVVKLLNKRADIKVEIGGHTDGKGSDELNLNLSQARADNVVAYLISKGIARERLIAKGYGASMPIAPNKNADGSDNPEGREKNRRTEMKVLQ